MLRNLSREASAQADDCARKATEAVTEQSQNDYLRNQQSWLALAHSYEFAERLLDFFKNKRRRAEFYDDDIATKCPPLTPEPTATPDADLKCNNGVKSPDCPPNGWDKDNDGVADIKITGNGKEIDKGDNDNDTGTESCGTPGDPCNSNSNSSSNKDKSKDNNKNKP